MAARQHHQKQNHTSVRRGFFFIFIVALAGVGLWRWSGNLFHRPGGADPERSSVQIAQPDITLPKEPLSEPLMVAESSDQTESPLTADSPVQLASAASTPPVNESADPAPQPIAAAPAVVANPAVTDFQAGVAALKNKDYIQARNRLSRAVEQGLDTALDRQARDLLNQSADQWLFSRNAFDGDRYCELYKVASGDLLVKIAKKHQIPYTFLMKINNIDNASKLRAGQIIKVVHGPFHVVVNLSKFQMSVYLGSALVRTYPVSIGAPGRQTPTGLWRVQTGKKQINPAWPDSETGKYYYPDDPENPLGERWIGLEGLEGDAVDRDGFGIHGTIKPEEIGKPASRGCIRLLNSDVEELYDMLEEGQSQIRVVP